jgi:DNA-directed RNA polymerase specialized sigma24 family protein
MKKPFADPDFMRGICGKCPHRSSCKKPCGPVKQYLANENLTVFEKKFTNQKGEVISILFSRSREKTLSAFKNDGDTDKNRTNEIELAFSTENGSAFAHYTPNLKQTRLFVDKFFFKYSIEDLAAKYEMSPQRVYEYYHQAKRRIFDILEHLDSKKRLKLNQYWEKIEARTGHMTKGRRWYLMSKVFMLTPSQIAEITGESADSISALIRRTADQLKAGEIELVNVSQAEAEAAKARLDSQRKKGRKRRANNKILPKKTNYRNPFDNCI